MKFLLLLCCVGLSEQNENAVALTGLFLDWTGKTAEPYILIGTAEGKFHYVDILNGEILWSIDTGGSVFASMEAGATHYVPSMDGYIFSYVKGYGYRRVPLPIRDLCFCTPFGTESGQVFISDHYQDLFFLSEDGKIETAYRSSNSLPLLGSGVIPKGKLTLVRINYQLNVYNEEEGSKSITYSEFDLTTGYETEPAVHIIKVTTTMDGGVTISLNGTVCASLKVPGTPILVIGSAGKFDFSMNMNGEKVTSNTVAFMVIEGHHVAIPAQPLQTPAKFEMLLHGLPALDGERGPKNDERFAVGLREVGRPYFQFEMLNPNAQPGRHTNFIDFMEPIVVAPCINIPYIRWAVILYSLFAFLQMITLFTEKLERTRQMKQRIIVDEKDPNIGTVNRIPCALARSVTTTDEILSYFSSTPISGIAKILSYEKSSNEWLIAYPQLQPLNWDSIDHSIFLKEVLVIMAELFNIGFVHGSIDKTSFFRDNQDRITLSKLEKTLRRSDSTHERAKDLKDIASLLEPTLPKTADPLLIDLLADMQNEDPLERPTPTEALQHPLFWTAQEKIVLLSKANDFLRSEMSNKRGLRAKFDENSEEVTGKDWKKYVDKELVRDASYKVGFYSGASTSDLIRLIRNKWQHPATAPSLEYLQDPDEYIKYFHGMFPNLFLYTYYFYDKYNNICL